MKLPWTSLELKRAEFFVGAFGALIGFFFGIAFRGLDIWLAWEKFNVEISSMSQSQLLREGELVASIADLISSDNIQQRELAIIIVQKSAPNLGVDILPKIADAGVPTDSNIALKERANKALATQRSNLAKQLFSLSKDDRSDAVATISASWTRDVGMANIIAETVDTNRKFSLSLDGVRLEWLTKNGIFNSFYVLLKFDDETLKLAAESICPVLRDTKKDSPQSYEMAQSLIARSCS